MVRVITSLGLCHIRLCEASKADDLCVEARLARIRLRRLIRRLIRRLSFFGRVVTADAAELHERLCEWSWERLRE